MNASSVSPKLDMSVITNIWSHSYEVADDTTFVSLTLSWMISDCVNDPIEHCNIYSSAVVTNTDTEDSTSPWKTGYVYQGRSYTKSFRLTNIYLPKVDTKHSTSVVFIIQPVTTSRRKVSVREAPSFTVKFCQ